LWELAVDALLTNAVETRLERFDPEEEKGRKINWIRAFHMLLPCWNRYYENINARKCQPVRG